MKELLFVMVGKGDAEFIIKLKYKNKEETNKLGEGLEISFNKETREGV